MGPVRIRIILKLDATSGAVQTCVDYKSSSDARPHQHSACLFKSGTLVGDRLYACTNTEILVFRVPAFEQLNYISLPCFNDVHHVTPCRDGTLLVVNTGLDMVVASRLRVLPSRNGTFSADLHGCGSPATSTTEKSQARSPTSRIPTTPFSSAATCGSPVCISETRSV